MLPRWAHSRSARHSRKSHGAGDAPCGAGDSVSFEDQARRLRESLQQMGPQFSCFALYLSSRIDLLPAEYCRELALTSQITLPSAPSTVHRLLTEELGEKVERSFDSIDYDPVQSTLITQSHRARLRTGGLVTVDLLRPEFHVLQSRSAFAQFLDSTAINRLCGELAIEGAITDFLNALQRKTNLSLAGQALGNRAEDKPCELLIARKIYGELSTARVLTLEHVDAKTADLVVAGRPYAAGELLRRVCRVWLELALCRHHFPVDPQLYNVAVSANHQISFDGCEFAALPNAARENLWHYLQATMVDDPDRSSMYLLREMQVAGNRDVDPQGFRSSFRQSAYFAVLEPVLGTDSNALPQLVFQHWKTALEHGYRPKPHLLCFYRGLFSVARMARSLSASGDHLREAMDEFRAARVFDQIRDFADWHYFTQNADKFASAMVNFPRTFDDALTRASRPPQEVFTRKQSDTSRSRSSLPAGMVALLFLVAAIFLSQSAGKNGFSEKLIILTIMFAGLAVLQNFEDREGT